MWLEALDWNYRGTQKKKSDMIFINMIQYDICYLRVLPDMRNTQLLLDDFWKKRAQTAVTTQTLWHYEHDRTPAGLDKGSVRQRRENYYTAYTFLNVLNVKCKSEEEIRKSWALLSNSIWTAFFCSKIIIVVVVLILHRKYLNSP